MKAVILAGGAGTRLAEETTIKPKPLVEVGGRPILLQIMEIYSNYGVNDFIILVGYKGHHIKEYFLNYRAHVQDLQVDLSTGAVNYLDGSREKRPWKVSIIDTGEQTMTGGRLLRVKHLLEKEKYFALTYGDGVSDLNIRELEEFHVKQGRVATVTAVTPPGRFGAMVLKGAGVNSFREKPLGDGAYINGGFFIMAPGIFDYLTDDTCVLEQKPLQSLADDGQLAAFVHKGFWQCMDTLRDKQYLDDLCAKRAAPWIQQ